MRGPRFVVRHLPVRPAPSGQATSGVFIAYPDLDEDFARSEPASHDEWRAVNIGLAPNQRNPVRQALKKIKDRFNRRSTVASATAASHHPGTVSLASRLGRLFDGTVTGTDPRIPAFPTSIPSSASSRPSAADADEVEKQRGPIAQGAEEIRSEGETQRDGGRTGRPPFARRPRASVGPTVRVVNLDGTAAVEFTAEVTVPDGISGAVIAAEPYVLLEGGRESDPPAGAAVPQVIFWREIATGALHRGPLLTVMEAGTSRWLITVSQPPDTAVSMRLDVREAVR